jgi:predicted transcriptional regulator
MDKFKLTKREKDLMEILWEAGKALAASDFPTYDETLKTRTAIIYLRKLLNKDLVQVKEFEIRSKAITRTYIPTLSKQEYETEKYFHSISKREINAASFIASLFDESTDKESELKELKELEKVIKERKAKLKSTEE